MSQVLSVLEKLDTERKSQSTDEVELEDGVPPGYADYDPSEDEADDRDNIIIVT